MSDKLGEVTITYFGPGSYSIDPVIGQLNRDVQTMTWNFIDRSGLNAGLVNPTGGIVFPFPPPGPPPAYSRWNPPGSEPTGTSTRYTANANDRIPHGNPRKLYSYDIVTERDEPSTQPGERIRVTEYIRVGEDRSKKQTDSAAEEIDEIIDPPIENQPQP